MARPDIYRINAFRMLEIPVTTSPRLAYSRMRKLNIMEKLGDIGRMQRGFLPLVPAPDSDARREAYQRLTDPESRLIDEFFWFWPLQMGLPEDEDEALVSVKRNDFTGAVAVWKQHEEKSSEANVSMHNLAILYHTLALDLECVAAAQTLSKKQSQQKGSYWEQAFLRWHILMEHEGFWHRLADRIRELGDPRLTTGTARRIRTGLPSVILSINAMLAVQAAQKGSNEEVSFHIGLMSQSGFDGTVIDEALRRAVAPLRDHIKTICLNAENETKIAPEHADEVVRSVIDDTCELLATLDQVLPEGHATRESVRDQVASQVLNSQIAFANKTENWPVSLELLERALKIVVSASMRRRMEENIRIIRNNLEQGTCWFCKKRPAADKAVVEVKMHGDVVRTRTWGGTNIQYRHITIKVPRCEQCKSAHSHHNAPAIAGWILAFVLGGISCGATENMGVGIGVFAACIGLGYGISALLKPSGIKSDKDYKEFPAIVEFLSRGWKFGEKPS